MAKDNFGNQLNNYLCPNTSTYTLFDNNWLDFHKVEYDALAFVVGLQEGVYESTLSA